MTTTAKSRPKSAPIPKVRLVRLRQICPSPENDKLYRPIDPNDAEIRAMAASMRKVGVLEPLVITRDGFVVSGHRRRAAAKLANLQEVPCRRLPIRRIDDIDAFVRLLREYNRQRDKTHAEKLREELVTISADDAHRELYEYRRAKAAVNVAPLKVGQARLRKAISPAKLPMLRAVQAAIEARRKFWPLSDRQIHYALLNDPPLRHASKPASKYRNDKASYNDLTDLLTRGRLANVSFGGFGDVFSDFLFASDEPAILFEAIGDETRPVEIWDVHQNVRSFIRREVDGMFRGYWRNLMQSQPNHIELVGEKNTVAPILKPIAAQYTIPLTTGRGYCSLAPRHAMAERFEASGKQKLVLLIVSDFDPEGEDIAHSFARSMRDDFGIDQIHPIKVALNSEQVRQHKLPPIMQAKVSSSRYKSFVKRYGKDVFELEALAPEMLQEIVREAIEAVIDGDAYAAEILAEREDAAFLEGARRTVCDAIHCIDLEGQL